VPSQPPDGSLVSWSDLAERHKWSVLFLGNGLSINVSQRFAYRELFDHVSGGGLTASDLKLFDGTPNFERALGDLSTAIRVAKVAGVDPTEFFDRYRRIQLALGSAIREVHPRQSHVGSEALTAIRTHMLKYEWIFTTSYDLILYWAMISERGRFQPFRDLFRAPSGRLEFDPGRIDIPTGWIPVYFLHGALHLIVGGSGTTAKLRATLIRNLLDQFGKPIEGDPQARPLLVTEGSARDKLRAIKANDYLNHCLERLSSVGGPMVVFGSRLSPEDSHLVDALNEQPDRPVAVSMMPGTKRELAGSQADIYRRLEVEELTFFDATTHPLGAPDLRVP
jgi:hypothetical protein